MDQLVAALEATLDSNQTNRVQAELLLAKLSDDSQVRQRALDATFPDFQRSASDDRRGAQLLLLRADMGGQQRMGADCAGGQVKEQVRALIFGGLADPVRKVRLACAVVVSDIAHSDWPDEWPSLMSQMLQLVSSSSPLEVEGGMRVLKDFVGIDLTEDQLLPIAKEMLPQLLTILGSPETHSPTTRARSILIFRQCIMTLFTVREEHPEAVKIAIGEIMPQWLDAFRQLLEVDPLAELSSGQSWDGIAIRIAIFHTLETILNAFPSSLKSSLPHFLSHASAHLSNLSKVYNEAYLSSTSDFSIPTSEEEDSDVPTDLSSLIATLLDFVTQVSRKKGVKEFFVGKRGPAQGLENSMDQALAYARMTTDDEDSWASDPNAFVADEDDEMVSWNVRAACIDFVTGLIDAFGDAALQSLWSAFQRRAAESDAAKSRSEEDWWKGYESGLALVGATATDLMEHVQESAEEGTAPVFDLGRLFTSIVPAFLTSPDVPFLQGRSFVFASQFSQALPAELATQYVDAAIQLLELASAGVPVKVSAVRALNNFFRHLRETIDAGRAAQTLARLLPLLPQTTENTLVLIVESCEATLKVAGPNLDVQTCSSVVSTILNIWLADSKDPMMGNAVCELFAALSSIATPAAQNCILTEALPTLATVLNHIKGDPFSPQAGAALEIIDSIFDGQPTPLGPGLFDGVAGVLFDILAIAEDRAIVQSGLHVITTVVRKDVNQLLSWRSAQGASGLELVLAQVGQLLQPGASESGGLFVGDLVLHLIRTASSSLGPVLPDLLKAFVTRLATAETASFSQSLILPFAYLAHTQADNILTLLEGISVPGVGSAPPAPALQILLAKWCDTVEVFQGYWNLKVNTVGLMQLYLSQRTSLQQVQVKGDLLITEANANSIMTRARAKNNPDQFSSIPFHAKALKILLHDVQRAGDDATIGKKDGMDEFDDLDSDDGDDEWADEGGEFRTGDKDLDFLSDMLGNDGALSKYMNDTSSDDGGLVDDDEDLKDDPVYSLDVQASLVAFFKQAYESNSNSFRQLAEQYLSSPEKEVLATVLGSP
ncbi:importin-9, partial [Phenoliferia sp. Uapishka_3]